MSKRTRSIAKVLSIAFVALMLSFSVKASAVEAELSHVTLFVEGMMKSRGGVTWMSWPDSVVVALSELPGIEEDNIVVNLERDAFTLSYDPARVKLEDMYLQITELGYSPGIEPPDALESDDRGEAEASPVEGALATAQRESKLVFVDFSAEWCLACKVLEEQVFSDYAVKGALSSYVFVEVDTDEYPQTAATYEVVGMPTLVILSSQGDELFRSVGLIEAADLQQKLEELVRK